MDTRRTVRANMQYKGTIEFDYAGIEEKLTFEKTLPHPFIYESYGVEPVWGIINNLIVEEINERIVLELKAPIMFWSQWDDEQLIFCFGSLPSTPLSPAELMMVINEALKKPISVEYYEYGSWVKVQVRPVIDKISVREVRLVNED